MVPFALGPSNKKIDYCPSFFVFRPDSIRKTTAQSSGFAGRQFCGVLLGRPQRLSL